MAALTQVKSWRNVECIFVCDIMGIDKNGFERKSP